MKEAASRISRYANVIFQGFKSRAAGTLSVLPPMVAGACGADFTAVFVWSRAVAGAAQRVSRPLRYAKA
jgi:hypothetical protein